jgi:hypothetical protein
MKALLKLYACRVWLLLVALLVSARAQGNSETIIFCDDFDKYACGKPPPARNAYEQPLWWHGEAPQVIVTDRDAVSLPFALELGDRGMAMRPFDRQRRKQLVLNLDFKILENNPGSYYHISLCGPGPSETWSDAALRLLVWQGNFVVPDRQAEGGNRVLEPIVLDKWYHLEARVDPITAETNRYDLTLICDGKRSMFQQLPFALPAPDLAAISSLNLGAEKGRILIDNIRLVAVAP